MRLRFSFGALLLCLAACTATAQDKGTVQHTILSGGRTRTYLLHVPASYDSAKPCPLVICFHGLGGTGQTMEDVTGFSALAEQQNFIVAYPDALNNTWFDVKVNVLDGNIQFIGDMLAEIRAAQSIDAQRIYATGMSQGGGMSFFMLINYPNVFAAIAPDVASIPLSFDLDTVFPANRAMPVLMLNGTADPLVSYWGGLGLAGIPTWPVPYVAFKLAQHDQCFPIPLVYDYPNFNWFDGCQASVTQYGFGAQNSEVILYSIQNGGHTWPGSRVWLPGFIFGNTCYDFDGTRVIWDFFARHTLPK